MGAVSCERGISVALAGTNNPPWRYEQSPPAPSDRGFREGGGVDAARPISRHSSRFSRHFDRFPATSADFPVISTDFPPFRWPNTLHTALASTGGAAPCRYKQSPCPPSDRRLQGGAGRRATRRFLARRMGGGVVSPAHSARDIILNPGTEPPRQSNATDISGGGCMLRLHRETPPGRRATLRFRARRVGGRVVGGRCSFWLEGAQARCNPWNPRDQTPLRSDTKNPQPLISETRHPKSPIIRNPKPETPKIRNPKPEAPKIRNPKPEIP